MKQWKFVEWFFFLFALYILANGLALVWNFTHPDKLNTTTKQVEVVYPVWIYEDGGIVEYTPFEN